LIGGKEMIYTLGVDIGTSGTKTILIDKNGNVIKSHTVEYPLYQPQNGYAEQNPLDWYNAVIKTISVVVNESGVSPEHIKGIGLSGQMHGLVMLDEIQLYGVMAGLLLSVMTLQDLLAKISLLKLQLTLQLQDLLRLKLCG